MIAIRALDGVEVIVNENAVTLVVGPYPSRPLWSILNPPAANV